MQTLLSDTKRGCYIELVSAFLAPRAASDLFFAALNSPFESEKYVMHGKTILTKRKTCAFGDAGVTYRYSGVTRAALPWPTWLVPVKSSIETKLGRNVSYNYALSTLYQDGGAGLGYHADNEAEINQATPICSISLGAARDFVVRDTATKTQVLKVALNSGDLLIMRGETQTYYQHALPERASRGNTRVSLTFRSIKV